MLGKTVTMYLKRSGDAAKISRMHKHGKCLYCALKRYDKLQIKCVFFVRYDIQIYLISKNE